VFQSRLAANPNLGAVIKGSGRVRKARVAVGGRGKSGGARVIYYWAVRRHTILLLFAYPKSVALHLVAAISFSTSRLVRCRRPLAYSAAAPCLAVLPIFRIFSKVSPPERRPNPRQTGRGLPTLYKMSPFVEC
jgi:hypothetical protein